MSSSSLAGAPLITIAVPAPSAGKNWAAELVGILVAMLMVPVNVSLDIYTDAESAASLLSVAASSRLVLAGLAAVPLLSQFAG